MLFACGPDCGIQLVGTNPQRKPSPASILPQAAGHWPYRPNVPEKLTSVQSSWGKNYLSAFPAKSLCFLLESLHRASVATAL